MDISQGSEYAPKFASKVKDVSFLDQFEYQRYNRFPSTRKNQKERAKRTSKYLSENIVKQN